MIRKNWEYLMARLKERSTLMTMGQAMVWSFGLPYPFSMVCFVVGILAALVPDGTVVKANAPAQ
jgi:hypothetical protein